MIDTRQLARLRITPCGLFEPITHTITLRQKDAAFHLLVVERHDATRKHSRKRVALSAATVHERLAKLKRTTVPAYPVSSQVCDGEYLELTIEGECSTLTLGWWTIAPDGADDLAAFADWLREIALGPDEDDGDG